MTNDESERSERQASTPAVLVAEDNRPTRKIMERIFEDEPVTVEFATDGTEALEAFEEDTYQLVLMDVRMPDMDGPETTRQIREREEQGDQEPTPIVALTADVHEEVVERCEEAGMTDFQEKPVRVSDLRTLLERYIDPETGQSYDGRSS